MNTQPEALRLAADLEGPHSIETEIKVVSELRRLHEVNQMLVKALDNIVYWYGARDKNDNLLSTNNQDEEIKQAMEALAKAKEQA